MVNLLNLLDFASKYFYTENTDNILFKNYLENINYTNGSIQINETTSNINVEQNMSIIIENNNNLILNFDYLPLSQLVKIILNTSTLTNAQLERDIDTIQINNTNPITQLKVTVSKYTDNDGITYKGFNKTITSLFDIERTIIYKQSNKWYLQSENTFNITTLTATNNVTLTNYQETNRESLCRINFPSNNPVSFNITNNNTNNFGLKCTYNTNNDSFNIGAYYG